jgi:hypothetical protein
MNAIQLYTFEVLHQVKNEDHSVFGTKSGSLCSFVDVQACKYSKKAPVRRRERRKRDNEQELKCKIGLNLKYHHSPVKSSRKVKFFPGHFGTFFQYHRLQAELR